LAKSIKFLYCFLIFALLTGKATVYADDNQAPAVPAETPSSSGTLPPDGATADKQSTEDLDVIFEVNPRQEKGKLYFDVETNLPDNMRFMCAIKDEIGVVYKMGSTMERLMTEVAGGILTMGPFPFEDRPFPPGEYTVYINSYFGQGQPESVIKIIGHDGVNLIGRNVFHGMVIFVKEFMITGTDN